VAGQQAVPSISNGCQGPLIRVPSGVTGKAASTTIRKPTSINNIRTAIIELTARAELAHKQGRDEEGAEIERRIQGYRDELGKRP
jgi:hypothetical protein